MLPQQARSCKLRPDRTHFGKTVYPGSSAYCCLSGIGRDYVGQLFEKDNYREIAFVRFRTGDLLVESPR